MAGILKVDRVQSDSNLAFQIGSSNVAYFNTDGINMTGNQIITGNGILRTTSGMLYANSGIAFPASQSSSADPNVLDDYEEGTWTPFWGSESTAPTVTYNTQLGRYVKIGSVVYFSVRLISSGSSGGTGNLTLDGFPFVSGPYGDAAPGFVSISFSYGWASGSNRVMTLGTQAGNSRRIAYTTYAGDTNVQTSATALAGATVYFNCSGWYQTAT
jgi:hypothetical protein